MKKISGYQEWIEPKLVENALELLEKQLPRFKEMGKPIYMCLATDPFMYGQEEVIDLSLKIIERLNREKMEVITISKGVHPKVLLKKDIYGGNNEYGATIVSLSEDFKKKYEPFAAPINDRIESLKFLHDNSFKTWVSIEPYPTPNIFEQDIEELLEKISFVNRIVFGKWNHSGLAKDFADYKEFYRDCVCKVRDFCKSRGIECYIKEETRELVK